MRQFCTLMLVLGLLAIGATAPTARADIAGFGEPVGFVTNQTNAPGLPNIVGDTVEMTTAAGGQATSLFYKYKQDVTDFIASFEYQDVTGDGADGIAFVLQNDVRGPSALGAGGHGRGYADGDNINDSAALLLDIYINSLYSFGVDGGYGTATSTGPVNLRSGNPIDVTLVYDGIDLTLGLAEQGTSNAMQASIPGVDIPALVGGESTAWVGFTGGTGGVVAYQTIRDFSFRHASRTLVWDGAGNGDWSDLNWLDNGAATAVFPDENAATVINDRIVTVDADREAYNLSVNPGTNPTGVIIAGNAVAANAATLSLASNVRFAPGTTLTMGQNAALVTGGGGAIDSLVINGNATVENAGLVTVANVADGATAGVLTKAGGGTLSLHNSAGSVDLNNTTLRVGGGTLALGGANPLGGSTMPVQLDGGTIQISGTKDLTPDPGMPNIAGLQLHLDAAAIGGLSDGATINQWNDLSGNNNHATLSRGTPIYRADANGDGSAAVEFGEGAGMFTPLTVAGDDYSVFIVFDSDQDSTVYRRAIHGSNNFLIGPYGGQLRYHMGGWAYIGAETMPVDQFVLAEASNSAAAWAFYENGVQRAAGAGSRGAPGLLSLGAEPWNERLLGDIAEVLVFDSALGEADRSDLNYHLQQKYALGPVFPIEMTGTDFVVSQDSTIDAQTASTADFGVLSLAGGVVTTTGAPGGMSFTQTNIAATATTVGINPQTATTYNTISGAATTGAFTFTKAGSSNVTFEPGSDSQLSAMGNATLGVSDGELKIVEKASWGGSTKMQLSGGTFTVTDQQLPPVSLETIHGYGAVLHLDAGDIDGDGTAYSEGDDVSTWRNKSGSALNNATATLGDPTYHLDALGGQPVVRFDGDDMITTGTSFPNPYTIMTVSQLEGSQNFRLIASANENWLMGYWGGMEDVMHAAPWVTHPGPGATTDAHIYGATGTGSQTRFYGDGADLTGNAAPTLQIGRLALGGTGYTGNPAETSKGDVAEVLIFDGALTAEQLDDVGYYLEDKYNVGSSYRGEIAALNYATHSVEVTQDSTLNAMTDYTATFGGLTLRGGTLTTTGAVGGVIFNSITVDVDPASGLEASVNAQVDTSFGAGALQLKHGVIKTADNPATFNGVNIPVGATAVGFNPQVATTYGTIDGNLTGATVSKTGAGMMVLTASDVVEMDNATWDAQGGTLALDGTGAWANSTEAQLSGGTMRISTDPVPLRHKYGAAAYYSFDNVNGAIVANDGTAVNKDGTLTDGATITTDGGGKLGEGMALADNTAQRLTVAAGGVDLGEQWTISSWFYRAHPSGAWRTLTKGSSQDHQIIVSNTDDSLGVYDTAGGGTWRDSGYDLLPSLEWHQITAVGDASNTTFYIDGEYVGISDRKSISDVTAIGNNTVAADAQPFAEKLDEFYVYDRALSATEAQALFDEFAAPIPTLPTINMPAKNFTVTADSTLLAASDSTAAFGSLALTGGMAAITGAPDGVSFTGLTVNAPGMETGVNFQTSVTFGAGPVALQAGVLKSDGQSPAFNGIDIPVTADAVGLNPVTKTTYGTIDGNLMSGTVAKTGPGKLSLASGNTTAMTNATWVAQGGKLEMVGKAAWGGSTKATLDGGTLVITDVAGTTVVDPADIGGLAVHFDAGDIDGIPGLDAIVDGALVDNWLDRSGNFYSAEQGDTGLQPARYGSAIGGKPVIRFDGTDWIAANPGEAIISGDEMAYFVVAKRAGAVFNTATFVGWTEGANALDFNHVSNFVGAYEGTDGSSLMPYRNGAKSTAANPGDGVPYVFASQYDGVQNTGWLDGDVQAPVASTGTFGFTHLLVGGRSEVAATFTPSNLYNGDIAEILIYDTALTADQQRQVGFYLEQKYGLDTGYRGPVGALTMTGYDISVTADSTLMADTDASAALAELELINGIATVTGAPDGVSFTRTTVPATAMITGINSQTTMAPGPLTIHAGVLQTSGQPIAFDSTAIPATATSVGLDPRTATDYGVITGGGAGPAVTISKLGPGSLGMTEANVNLANATWDAREGTLAMLGTGPLGGSTELVLSGGTFKIAGALSDVDNGPADARAAYYSFDNSGDPGHDDTGGADGRLMNGVAWTADSVMGAGAMSFDGVNDFISADVNVSETNYAVAMWFKADADNRGLYSVNLGDLSGTSDRHVFLTGGNASARTYNNEVIASSGQTLADGLWHHVVHTFGDQPGGQKLYVDGVLAAEGLKDQSDFDSRDRVNIGFSVDGAIDFHSGLIDEVYIYDRELTAAEVNAMAGERGAVNVSGVNVTVTGDSTLAAAAGSGVTFAGLNMKYGVLATSGVPVSFPATTIDPSASIIGFNPMTETNLGPLDGSNAAATIRKTGTGDLVLTDAGSNLGNATFSVESGRLVAMGASSIGAATLQPTGGELVLSAKAGSTSPVLYDNAVVANGGTLGAGMGGQAGAADGPMTVQVGSAGTNDVTVPAGVTLQLRSTDDYTLELTGNLIGDGQIVVDDAASKVTIAGPASLIGSMSVTAGTVNVPATMTVSTMLALGEIEITDDQPLQVVGTNLATRTGTLTVSGGAATIAVPPVPGALVPLAGIAATAENNLFSNITQTTAWVGMDRGTQAVPDKEALQDNAHTSKWTPDANNFWGKWHLDNVDNASFAIGEIFWWQYNQAGSPNRGIPTAKLYYSNDEADPGDPKNNPENWTLFYDNTAGTGLPAWPLANTQPNNHTVVDLTGFDFDARWISILPTTPAAQLQHGNGLGTILFSEAATGGLIDMPNMNLDLAMAGPSATVTLDGSTATLGDLTMGAVTDLTIATADSVSFNNVTGTGSVNIATMEVRGIFAPGGDGIGTMTIGSTSDLTLGPEATYDAGVSLGDGSVLDADKIVISKLSDEVMGSMDLNGTLAPKGVGRTGNDGFSTDTTLTVIDNTALGVLTGVTGDTPHEFNAIDPAPAADKSSHIGQGAFLRDVIYVPDNDWVTRAVDLEVFVALGGDSDGDGKVWLSDWAALRANFGNTGSGKTWTDGNFDPWTDDKVWLSDWAAL
ncbi:MAG: hypothetical protein HQ567_18355, partial [Candidatus Nealsonbacteria bacterium]|nr:hypothetical protein [Candidatus Nealsonbacteria bacterium]